MRRTTTQLADGRELIYFDDDATRRADRATSSTRATCAASHRVGDPLRRVLDEWVAIAVAPAGPHPPAAGRRVPAVPVPRGRHTEIPADDYDVVVFENRFPSLRRGRRPRLRRATGERRRRAGAGARWSASPATTTRPFSRAVARAGPRSCSRPGPTAPPSWPRCRRSSRCSASRTAARRSASRCATRTGRSTPTRSSRRGPARMLDAARQLPRAHRRATSSPTCSPPSGPTAPRVVTSSEHWTAFVPVAARWPVEVHLYPHRQVPDLPALTDAERDDFAALYLDLLRRARRPVRRAAALHRGLAPGAGRASTATWPTCTSSVLDPAGGRQAQVPGRLGVGDGRVHQRHRPGAARGELRDGGP